MNELLIDRKMVGEPKWCRYFNLCGLVKKENMIHPPNTTKKMIDVLKKGEDVLIFYLPEWNNTGIYHVCKEVDCDTIFVRIENEKLLSCGLRYPKIKKVSRLVETFSNEKYDVALTKEDMRPFQSTPKVFIEHMKRKLFTHPSVR